MEVTSSRHEVLPSVNPETAHLLPIIQDDASAMRSLNSRLVGIAKTVFFVTLGGIACAAILYGTGVSLATLGSTLATKTIFKIKLVGVSKPLIAIGQSLGGAGKLLFTAVTKPIVFVIYDTPNWVMTSALPGLRYSAQGLASRISATANPCFRWLGDAGEAIGKVFDWLVHQVLADGVKIIDKFITDIWKSVVTGIAYFVSNLVCPSAKGVVSLVGRLGDLTNSASEWVANKVIQAYRTTVNYTLKPVWNSITDTIKSLFNRIVGGASSRLSSHGVGNEGFSSMLAEMFASEEGMPVGEFLAQQHQILASFQR